jgi:hypothetical protein
MFACAINQLREDLLTAQQHLHRQAGKTFFSASCEGNLIPDSNTVEIKSTRGPNDWDLQKSASSEMHGPSMNHSKQGVLLVMLCPAIIMTFGRNNRSLNYLILHMHEARVLLILFISSFFNQLGPGIT